VSVRRERGPYLAISGIQTFYKEAGTDLHAVQRREIFQSEILSILIAFAIYRRQKGLGEKIHSGMIEKGEETSSTIVEKREGKKKNGKKPGMTASLDYMGTVATPASRQLGLPGAGGGKDKTSKKVDQRRGQGVVRSGE